MKLNKMLLAGVMFFTFGGAAQAMAQARHDCPRVPWSDYGQNVNGGACQDAEINGVRLNTRRGTCVPGYKYEVLCDDRRNPSTGRPEIRICNGRRICHRNGNPNIPPTPHKS